MKRRPDHILQLINIENGNTQETVEEPLEEIMLTSMHTSTCSIPNEIESIIDKENCLKQSATVVMEESIAINAGKSQQGENEQVENIDQVKLPLTVNRKYLTIYLLY